MKSKPKAITTRDPHLIDGVVRQQARRKHKTAAKTMAVLLAERLAQLELSSTAQRSNAA